jgi:penicillin-binding protein 2
VLLVLRAAAGAAGGAAGAAPRRLATQAEANRIAVVPIVPNRGLIVDRNGVVLATNYSAYTLEITPSRAQGPLDAADRRAGRGGRHRAARPPRFKRLLDESKSFESLPIRTKLTDEEVARFTAQRFRFPGVDVKARLFRNYPLGETGSHLLGYIGRINQAEKKAMEEWPDEDQANYRGTEYIGKLGLEQSYERELHGSTGFEEVETSAGGRAVRRLDSHPPRRATAGAVGSTSGCRRWWRDVRRPPRRAGGLDPRNGEVLAFVSKPTFDPNLFVDGIDSESWRELNESIDKPLLNRALRGTYPPGSTFKPFMAMAALNTGKRAPGTGDHDGGTFQFGNHTFRSHGDTGLGPVDMTRSIVKSSNVYYYSLANEMGVDLIHEQLSPFGFGRKTGIDLEGEVTGVLPSTDWKRRTYKKPEQQRWYAGETISLGIGQGYNNFTMLQLASATATLVSGGQRFKPRLVREVEDVVTRERARSNARRWPPLPFKPEHVDLIRKALHGVTQEGTSTRVFMPAPLQAAARPAPPRRWACARTRSTTPPSWRSTSATIRCTSRWRRWRRPPSRWRWWWRTPASVPRPPRPSRGGCSTTCCWASTPAKRTWPPRASASPSAPIGTPRRRPTCRCPAAPGCPLARQGFELPAHLAALAAPEGRGEDGLREPLGLAAPAPGVQRLRRPAGAGHAAAGGDRPDHHVLGRLRPRHALRRPRPQHAAGAGLLFVVAQVPPQKLQRWRCRCTWWAWCCWWPPRCRVGHHQEGRHPLAEPGRRDPAQRDPEDRHAADAGLVVPEARGQLRALDFLAAGAAAAAAGGAGGQAARPGHLAADPVRRAVRDLLRRAVVAAGAAGAGCWARWAWWRWSWPRPTRICEPGVRWPVLRDYQQHRVCTLLDPPRTRWARASTSSRA